MITAKEAREIQRGFDKDALLKEIQDIEDTIKSYSENGFRMILFGTISTVAQQYLYMNGYVLKEGQRRGEPNGRFRIYW